MSDQPAPTRDQRREVVGLDLLRFAAAAMVMAFHLGFWQWAAPETRTNRLLSLGVPLPAFGSAAANGWVGVEIFFVISGFVIAWSAERASWERFARSRFLRLAPAAWICALLSTLVLLASQPAHLPELLKPLAKTLTFFPTPPWIDDAYWTLDVEIAFYAIVALTLAAGQRSRIGLVVGVLGAASAAWWLIEAGLGEKSAQWMVAASRSRYFELALIRHGCFFCLGVLFWRAMEAGRLRAWDFGLGALCVAAGLVEIADSAAAKNEVTGFAHGAAAPSAIWLAALVAMGLSIRFNARLQGVRALRRARSLGLATYPLYLLHTTVGGVAMKALMAAGWLAPAALAGGAGVALALAVCVSEALEPRLRRVLSGARLPYGARVASKLGGDLA